MEHAHEEVDFKMEITGVFKDALTGQAEEAVRIKSRKNSELNHPPIARVVVEGRKSKYFNANPKTQVSPGL